MQRTNHGSSSPVSNNLPSTMIWASLSCYQNEMLNFSGVQYFIYWWRTIMKQVPAAVRFGPGATGSGRPSNAAIPPREGEKESEQGGGRGERDCVEWARLGFLSLGSDHLLWRTCEKCPPLKIGVLIEAVTLKMTASVNRFCEAVSVPASVNRKCLPHLC